MRARVPPWRSLLPLADDAVRPDAVTGELLRLVAELARLEGIGEDEGHGDTER